MTDVFAETRRLVSAREVAELNGLHLSRNGFVCCPFHGEKTPSLKFFQDGGFYCFGCHTGGSVIDFVCKLFDLSPLEAVKKLDTDFSLGLELDKLPDAETRKANQRRQEVRQTYELFEEWKNDMIWRLTACFREGHLALQSLETPADLDRLTDAQALAIREQPRFEWLVDMVIGGTMSQQMDIFRDRKGVDALCEKVLSNTLTKSNVA